MMMVVPGTTSANASTSPSWVIGPSVKGEPAGAKTCNPALNVAIQQKVRPWRVLSRLPHSASDCRRAVANAAKATLGCGFLGIENVFHPIPEGQIGVGDDAGGDVTKAR